MPTPISVLILEDRAADAELMIHQLRRSGYDAKWSRVDTEREFLAQLDPAPEIILSDYQMPQFDGLRALEIVKQRGLDIPFILVSGTIGEDLAVETIKRGASDYLLKDRLARLGPAVARVLEEKRLRDEKVHAEDQIAYQAYLLSNVNDAVIAIDENFIITSWNMAAERIYGWKKEEVLGKSTDPVLRAEFFDQSVAQVRQQLLERGEYFGQVIQHRKDGTVITVEGRSSALRNSTGKIVGYITVNRDITARKRAEEALAASEMELRNLFAAMTDVILVLDAQGRYLQVAPTNPSLLYKPSAELVGKTIHEVLPTADADNILSSIRLALEKQEPIQLEYCMRINGAEIWFDGTVSPLSKDQVFWIARDITERKKAEEKIQRQFSHLAALHTVDLAIASSTNLQVTLDILLTHVTDQLHVDAADILLLDPVTNMIQRTADRGFRSRLIEESQLHLGEGLAGKAALERKTIHSPNLLLEGKSLARSRLVLKEGFVASYAVPLIGKDKVKGVLEIFHRAPFKEDREWKQLLEGMATQATLAIDNNQLFTHLVRSNTELEHSYDSTIEGWSRALDLRDRETEGHTQRVTEMSILLAREMGMSESDLVDMRRGALLHDIGKMGVPDAILLKPGSLTDDEWVIMRQHPVLAFELLAPVPYLRHAIDIPHYHHERWDGTGYPRGLKGAEIPLMARIFAIIDVWDALRSERLYREPWPEAKVRQYLKEATGKQFDPKVVEAFLILLDTIIPEGKSDSKSRATGFPARVFKI